MHEMELSRSFAVVFWLGDPVLPLFLEAELVWLAVVVFRIIVAFHVMSWGFLAKLERRWTYIGRRPRFDGFTAVAAFRGPIVAKILRGHQNPFYSAVILRSWLRHL